MTQICLGQTQEIIPLINLLNHSVIFDSLNITSFSPQRNYLKWFAPSIDYPCILSAYYLLSPFTITFSPIPKIEVAGEIGESDYLLDAVKAKLLQSIVDFYLTP